MPNITIKPSAGGRVAVVSPYLPAWTTQAKRLSGQWDSYDRAWLFDAREETRVRAALVECYGTDGSPVPNSDLATIRLTFASEWVESRKSLFLCGREIAGATGRDSGARLGEGVVLLSGGVRSGGSVKNWTTIVKQGTQVELRDVPRAVAEALQDQYETTDLVVEVLPNAPPPVDHSVLLAERARLVARLAEIDAILNPAQEA